ncbi:hypothetical protein [Maritimibacter fusiformis]|uniref:Uncharacterized protein n=1 Tax=Maritimibacter fusiformis TaxID=2603819 RepID=A0A5D0RMB3_9RHOB|nr:hypothetical protein [Maritimibacter fusiformis]TYB81768.1 hypothetical protein FVF75_08670 [Maritimibacter fusiformis]
MTNQNTKTRPASQAASGDDADAHAFRARAAAIMRSKYAVTRPKQALMLALGTTLSHDDACAALAAMKSDSAEVNSAVLVDPGAIAALPKAARQERGRLVAILTCSEAEGRATQAAALAFDTLATVEQAIAVMATMPRTERYMTIAERAAGEPEFGADFSDHWSAGGDRVGAAWDRAIANSKAAHRNSVEKENAK